MYMEMKLQQDSHNSIGSGTSPGYYPSPQLKLLPKLITVLIKHDFIPNFTAGLKSEDVKDIYIKALGLKSYTKGLIDIRTDEVWFEAKDTGKHSSYAMFTQLLHYVQVALNQGENHPFLAVIDTEKKQPS